MIEFLNMDKISSKDIIKVIHMKNDEGEDRSINIIKNGEDKVSISINIHRYMTDDEGFRVDTGIMDHILVATFEMINGGICVTRHAEAMRKDDSKFKRKNIVDKIFYGTSKEDIEIMSIIERHLEGVSI